MTDFKDSKGRVWTLKLTLGSAKEIYDRLGIDLLNPAKLAEGDESIVSRLAYDLLLVGDILAVLLEKQRQERDVENLLDDFDGETCAAASDAFLTEYERFFTDQKNPRAASVVRLIREVGDEVRSGETSSGSPDAPESQITPTSPSTN